MARPDHLRILAKGTIPWNRWRNRHPDRLPDLSGAPLARANLRGANLRHANLRDARLAECDLHGALLFRADLTGADLQRARLREADLGGADLTEANLAGADLTAAYLARAIFHRTRVRNADFSEARLYETSFAAMDLAHARDLARAVHWGPSVLDHRTLARAEDLPLEFLRGAGVPNALIPGAVQGPMRPACYIGYAEGDAAFAERLHDDLQEAGVRCWLVPEHTKKGTPIPVTIEGAAIPRDKLILIFSERSLRAPWLGGEIEHALAEEREQKDTVLFSVRLDDALFNADRAWARAVQRRPIADFGGGDDDGERYGRGLEALLDQLSGGSPEPTVRRGARTRLHPPFSLGGAT